jgi:hypothetical protein
MRQLLAAGRQDIPQNGEVNGLGIGGDWTGSTYQCQNIITTAGKLSHLRVLMTNPAPFGETKTFTVYRNGIATALQVNIVNPNDRGEDGVHEVAVVPGDLVCIYYASVPPAAAPGYVFWSSIFEGDNPRESLIFGSMQGDRVSTFYHKPGDVRHTPSTVESRVWLPVPISGKLKNLWAHMPGLPGPHGSGWTIRVRRNGANTALQCSIAAPNQWGWDTVDEVIVAVGDLISVSTTAFGGPAADTGTVNSWGLTFVADEDDQSIIWGGTSDDVSAVLPWNYPGTAHSNEMWQPNARNQLVGVNAILRKLYMRLENAPGGANWWDFALQDDGVDTPLDVRLTGAEVVKQSDPVLDLAHVAEWSLITFKSTPGGAPAVGDSHWSMVISIQPGHVAGGAWEILPLLS